MAYPARSLRMVAVGDLPSGETWNTGLWALTDAPITSYADLVLSLAVPQSAFNDLFAFLHDFWSATTQARELRAYYYSGGEFGSVAEFSATVPLDANTGAGSPILPDQCTPVASLRTGRAGRSYRGRMYLPYPKLALTAAGQMGSSAADDLATAVAACITAINGGGMAVSVVSATQASAVPVTNVLIDTVVDTQRRRRNKISPTHIANANV